LRRVINNAWRASALGSLFRVMFFLLIVRSAFIDVQILRGIQAHSAPVGAGEQMAAAGFAPA
jgi:hypothetical protein